MTGRSMKLRKATVSCRQAPGLRKSTLRGFSQRRVRAPARSKETQSDRLHNIFKCDIRATDYALKSAALLVASGALSTGSYSVLKSADNILEVLNPLAGFAGSLALLVVAFQLMCAFALSFDRTGKLRGSTIIVRAAVVVFIAAVIGQLAPLFVTIWTAGL